MTRFLMAAGAAVLMAAGAALLAAQPATAQPLSGTLQKIKETGEITIGYRETSIPFSYLDDKQQPVGFAMDICARIVEAVKAELKLEKLAVKLNPVTSATRIPLMANGTVDLECGSTTNNLDRQKQVWFTNSHFATASRYVTKAASNIKKIDDLKGKTIVSTAGSTNMKQATEANVARGLGMTIIPAKDHAEGFLMVETDRAAAFVMDDIILSSLIAVAKDPKLYHLSEDAFSLPEPYGIMLRKDDVPFKKLVDATTAALYKSPEGTALFEKWFQKPIPPRGINLNVALDARMKKILSQPTDSADPAAY